jgi:hypothetical protein
LNGSSAFTSGGEAVLFARQTRSTRTGPLKILKSSTGKSMLCSPNRTACLAGLGVTVLAGSPIDVGKLIGDETEKLAKVIRANNIKAE